MASVTVTPEQFTMVLFERDRIAELATEVADKVGLPADIEVHIEVIEQTPLGRARVVTASPLHVSVEGGAFENAKAPRTLSDKSVVDVLGRLFHRAKDRLDPAFGEPPDDESLTLQQQTAWDTYAVGRCERIGYAPQKTRRLYHFRNRHGFTDVADGAFERLWAAEGLTWADLEAVCAETAAAKPAAPKAAKADKPARS